MKTIQLSTGEVVMLDDEDLDRVSGHRWNRRVNASHACYVKAYSKHACGKQTSILIHRVIMNAPQGYEVLHKDGNALNNQKYNLQIGTRSQNARSIQKKRPNCSSVFRGVHWSKSSMKWRAVVQLRFGAKKVQHHAGMFDSEIDAALAYNAKAEELGFYPEALNKVA